MAHWELGVEKEDGWHVMGYIPDGPESLAQYWVKRWKDLFDGLEYRPRGVGKKRGRPPKELNK